MGICLQEPPGNTEEGGVVCVTPLVQSELKHRLLVVNFLL